MSRVTQIGTMLVAAAIVPLAACSGRGQAWPLPAPTTIAGASAGVVMVTQEDVAPASAPESGVVVGFEGGQYLIATASDFQVATTGKYQLGVSISVAGTTRSAQATSMYACMDGPWGLLAVPAADLPRLPVLRLGSWGAGPAWLAMAGHRSVGVRITGPVDPGQFALYDWGADPDADPDSALFGGTGDLLQFSPSVARAIDRPPAFSPAQFGGAALLEQVSGGVRLVGLGDGLLGNAGNTLFVGVATGVENIEYLLKHPGGCS